MPKKKKSSIIAQSISSTPSIRRSLSSNDIEDEFSTVVHNKKKKNQSITTDQLSHPFQDTVTSIFDEIVPIAPVIDQIGTQSTNDINQQPTPTQPVPAQPVPAQPSSVTNDSTRYALSRFPFPPFTIRFDSGKILPSHVKEELVKFCKQTHQVDIQILNCRSSRSNNNAQEQNLLLHLKDAQSFSFLLDVKHWPPLIKNQHFSLPSLPSIPPQLSLLIKDVDLNIDYDDFCSDIKSRYPEVQNVIRMKNKFQHPIRMMKIELTSPGIRDKLLDEKRIVVNLMYYTVAEYLAPFQVLICSKCCGIGHFRNVCTQVKSTCKVCCELMDNPVQHKCSKETKCAHCGGNHKSTSTVCPIIKTYRADLTRKILQPVQKLSFTNVIPDNPVSVLNLMNVPRQYVSQSFNNIDMMKKLDDLIGKISDVKDHLAGLSVKHGNFEKFVEEKNQNDQVLQQNLNSVSQTTKAINDDVTSLRSKVVRQVNVIERLMIPMFTDIFQMFLSQISNVIDGLTYSKIKQKLDRYLMQMQNVCNDQTFLS